MEQWRFLFRYSTFLACDSDFNIVQLVNACLPWQKLHKVKTATWVSFCGCTLDASLLLRSSALVTEVTKLLPLFDILRVVVLGFEMVALTGIGSLIYPKTG